MPCGNAGELVIARIFTALERWGDRIDARTRRTARLRDAITSLRQQEAYLKDLSRDPCDPKLLAANLFITGAEIGFECDTIERVIEEMEDE